ncbi:MAG: GAF domain-containing protein, partial [Chloroflexi bacterium]|nr:GAF domain-containing protein [Chloroflexota bacterium]
AEASERQQRIVAEALRDTAAVLNTTLDLDEIMDRILENVAGVVPFTSGCIFLIEEGIARVVRQRGYQKHGLEDWIAQLRLPIMETPNLRRMVETQQPVLVADTRADPDWVEYPETAWIAAYLAAPVVVKGEVVGMIGLDHEQAGFFGAASIEHLMAFANQAASAIENARLYQEALRAAERRAVLHRSSQEMVRVSRDPEQVYEAARQAASQLMPAEVFTVALLDEERQELDATYLFDNVGRHPPLRIPLGQGFSSQVIISGEAILNNDLQKSPLQAVHFGSEAQVRSVLAVPMRIGGKVIGAISSQSYQPGAFDQEDRLLLEMLAAQTAAAIENARLFSETQHRLREMEALVQVSEATGRTLELDILLENILAAALKAIPAAEKGSISLREDGRLRLHSLVGYADERLRGLFFEPGEGFVSQALREGRAMLVHDASAEKMPRSGSEIEEMLAIQSAVIAPLISKERIIGIISLDNASRKSAFTEADTRLLVTLAAEAAMAIENSRLYIQTQRRAEEFASLYETARDLAGRHDLPSLIQTIVERARLLLHASDGAMYLYDAARQALDSVVVTNPAMPRLNLKLGEGLAGRVVQERQAMIVDDYRAWEGRVARYEGVPISAVVDVPMLHGGELVGVLVVHEMGDTGRRFTEEDARLLSLFAAQAAGAVYNARLLEETRQRLAELEAVNRVSTALRTAGRVEDMLPLMLDETLELVKAEVGAIWLYDAVEGKLQPMVAFGWQTGLPHKKLGPGEGIIGHTFNLNEVYVTPDYHTDPHLFAANKKYIPAGWGGVCVPLRTFNQTLGIFIVSIPSSRQLTSGEIKLLTTVAEISGNAIRRAMLHEQTELQLHRLATLRAIDTAISSLFDLRLTLDILLEHTVAQLKVDAVSVLTFNPNTLMLEFAAGRGFRGQATAQLRLRLGESQAGRAALERRRIFIPQLQEANSVFAQPELLAGEDFAAYCALPLIAKGQVKGVLEVFHRQPLERDADWMNFLETLAGQFALAIENASLFDGLQRSNIALSLAYDATIEGWSKALDLRDEETEGHTQRVTDLTLRLGRALNIGEDEMVHIRRGALLHDIGKMGVPDSILHKPGPLTDDEWALMRKHPVFAFDMLLPIDFLRPALDIPYCHHEKWDGSGYPRSLKGEQIPLAARIFAVVDVWDALSSDRPYRQAWPKEKVINYLEEQSGAHFDPRVVEAFLKLIEGNEVAGIMKSVE